MAPKSDTMMTLAIHDQRLAKPGLQNAALRDYDSVRRAIAFISEHWRTQPTIEAMADAAAVTPDELHHLFRRWAGLTPKAFMQALTLDHAKNLLRDSASVLDAALDSGLSGPGRLHDLFVTHEAMSPGEWKTGGGGMTLRYGFHPSPFGTAIVIATDRGLAGLAFADPGDEQTAFADMKRRWPNATYVEDTDGTTALGHRGRPQPGVVRGALPPRPRQERRTDRLPLGYHPKAGDARLGSRPGRVALIKA